MRKIAIILLSMITMSIYAQDTTKTIKLTDIEITGVRTDTKTPISQKTLTKDDIAKTYQGQEMTYILDKTPSITTQSDGGQPNGYTTFRMRGIDQTRINMTLNGVPLNEPEDQGVYFSNYPNFATNIKSIQIQRGVGTSANGTASYGGSLNFEGKTGIDKETSLQVGYGSFNTQRANLSYGSGINKKGLAIYTGLSAYKSDGYKYNSGGSGYSAFVSGGYYGGKNVIKFTGFTGRSLNKMAWFAVSEADIKLDPRTNYNPAGENDDFTQSFGQLQYVRSITKNTTLTTTAYYNRLDGKWGLFVNPTDLLTFKLGSNFYGGMTNYHYEANKLTINVGLHANSYNRTHMGSIDTLFLYKNTGTKVDYSAYTKIAYNIGKFTLFTDLQVRKVGFSYVGDSTMVPLSWNFFNPKGGITYNYSKNTNYYFSVGQNHREPTRTDMFGGQDNLVSLNIITPEQVIDYELGSNLKFNKILVQYNLYYMDFKNEITFLGGLGPNGLNLMTNVSKSFRSGIELDLNYKVMKCLSITNTSNYAYSRIQGDGKEYTPLYTPNFVSNTGVLYTYKGFDIGINAKYQSFSYINADNTSTIPSYVLYNATIGYTYKAYSIAAQAVNITNTRYYTSGYTIGTDKYLYVNAPLSGYLTIKAVF
jgi:iron complex outermembrane receptor protein